MESFLWNFDELREFLATFAWERFRDSPLSLPGHTSGLASSQYSDRWNACAKA